MKRYRLLWMLLGAVSMLSVLFLLGATDIDISAPHYGRYQISSWSTRVDNQKAIVGAFVLDTATGETKNVYTRIVDSEGNGKVLRNNLHTTFYKIK